MEDETTINTINSPASFACPKCRRFFNARRGLETHYGMAHPGTSFVNAAAIVIISVGAVYLAVKLASIDRDAKQVLPKEEPTDEFPRFPTFEQRYLPAYVQKGFHFGN